MVSIEAALVALAVFLVIAIAFFAWCAVALSVSADRRFGDGKVRKPRKPRLVQTGRRDDEAA